MTSIAPRRAVETIFRMESARLIAGLTRYVCDVGLAEELAQDALVAALERWPASGVPDNPGAWLMTTAKNRAINEIHRRKRAARKHEEIGRAASEEGGGDPSEALAEVLDDDVGDDLLRLVFTACHPVLSPEARLALALRLLCGLSTAEIARAFLSSEPTIAQRIVRAKKTLADARVPFEIPRGDELATRLSSVLEVIYLLFNEGYAATAGDDVGRAARRSCSTRRTGRGGIDCSSGGASPGSNAPRVSRRTAGPTRCRPPSPRVMRAREPRRRPTGRASPRSTASSPCSRDRRSSS